MAGVGVLENQWGWYRGQGMGGTFWSEMLRQRRTQVPWQPCSPTTPLQGYHEYINENLPPESPYLYGLHPNAEIGFLTVTSEKLFRTVLEMQPKETDSGAGTGVSREEKAGVSTRRPAAEKGRGPKSGVRKCVPRKRAGAASRLTGPSGASPWAASPPHPLTWLNWPMSGEGGAHQSGRLTVPPHELRRPRWARPSNATQTK